MTIYNPKEINIIFSTDKKYYKYCSVAITSIKESQKDFDKINIYILAKNLPNKICTELKKLSNNILKINLINFKSLNVNHLKIQNPTLPDPTYYKLLIPKILPKVDKILYLDCDVIVKKSLKELWQINISNYLLAAVSDLNEKLVLDSANAPQNKKKYFNAGVMLINLKKWREEKTLERLKTFLKNPTALLRYSDQCIFNFGLNDYEILFLDNKWNFHYNSPHPNSENAAIIHYVWDKPWLFSSLNAYRNDYWQVVKKTKWKNEIYLYKIINSLANYHHCILKRKILNFIKNKIIKKCRIK